MVPVVVIDEMEEVVGAKTDRLRQLAREYGYLEKDQDHRLGGVTSGKCKLCARV